MFTGISHLVKGKENIFNLINFNLFAIFTQIIKGVSLHIWITSETIPFKYNTVFLKKSITNTSSGIVLKYIQFLKFGT